MGFKNIKRTRFLVEASLIAAFYAVITIALAPISYGQMQVRLSEALTVLPYFTTAAIPGLFIGCIVANILGGFGPIDIIFGSLASLIAAILARKISKPWLVPLPSVVLNGLVIGWVLNMVEGLPFWLSAGTVTLGQAIACYGLGYPLLLALDVHRDRIFSRGN